MPRTAPAPRPSAEDAQRVAEAEATREREAAEHRARNVALAARMATVPDAAAASIKTAPRFAPGFAPKPGDVVRVSEDGSKLLGRWLCCSRYHCGARLDTDGMSEAEIARFAEVHGYVRAKDRDGKPAIFCSRRCHELETSNGEGKPRKKEEAAKPLRPPQTLKTPHGVLTCDKSGCEARVELEPNTEDKDGTLAAKAAAAMGWIETEHGLFCGQNCARQARGDAAAGIARKEVAATTASAEAIPT
ncbi:MAG TPA: hypothetical protein VGI39_39135 [Polyangiaceae bacterium]